MKIRFLWISLMVLALFAAGNLYASGGPSGAAKGKGRIKGTIKDEQGKPIGGVTVRFSSDKIGTSFDVTSDDKGVWVVNGISAANWNVDFIKEGYDDKKLFTQISELGYNKPMEITMHASAQAPPAAAGGGGGNQAKATPGLDLVREGNTLKDNKDYPGAIAKYEAALQANPNLFMVYGDIGESYEANKQPDKAIEAYKKVLEKDPANAQAKVDIARLLLQQKNIEEAKKTLADVDWSKVTDASELYNLGVDFYNLKETQDAIKYWEQAVSVDPKMSEAFLQIGLAYYAAGNSAKAKENLQKCIALDPNSDSAKQAQELLATIK